LIGKTSYVGNNKWVLVNKTNLFYTIQDGPKKQSKRYDKTPNNADISKKADDSKKDGIAEKDVTCHNRILSALFDNFIAFSIIPKPRACDLWTSVDQIYVITKKGLVIVSTND